MRFRCARAHVETDTRKGFTRARVHQKIHTDARVRALTHLHTPTPTHLPPLPTVLLSVGISDDVPLNQAGMIMAHDSASGYLGDGLVNCKPH